MSFGKKQKQPEIPRPVVLPDPTDIAVTQARALALKKLNKRRGYSRTLLTRPLNRLGTNELSPLRRVEPIRNAGTIATGGGV